MGYFKTHVHGKNGKNINQQYVYRYKFYRPEICTKQFFTYNLKYFPIIKEQLLHNSNWFSSFLKSIYLTNNSTFKF